MGIYIKGMEMPTSCGYCWLKYFDGEGDCCPFIGNPLLYSQRPNDCPLVPVPPHGDLVERELLHELVNWTTEKPPFSRKWVRRLIDTPPTIIEAEEGECREYEKRRGSNDT